MKDNNEYKTCPDCCYDILDDEGDVMDHECISDNEMIAEFMDLRSTGMSIYKESEYKYHTSWDWLMPVVRKIEEQNELIGAHILSTDRDATYKAVVKFIKQYNDGLKK